MLPKLLLHLDNIGAKPIFSGELKTVGEMVDLLILIQAFIDILLVRLTGPQDVPVMGFR